MHGVKRMNFSSSRYLTILIAFCLVNYYCVTGQKGKGGGGNGGNGGNGGWPPEDQKADSFPSGSFSLIVPAGGDCPTEDGWSKANISIDVQYIADVRTTGPMFTQYEKKDRQIILLFCTRNHRPGAPWPQHLKWPKGRYCVFQKEGNCPQTLLPTNITLPLTLLSNSNGPVTPDNNDTIFQYCCKKDDRAVQPLRLESEDQEPFYLIPLIGELCPKVSGYFDTRQQLVWTLDRPSSGSSPKFPPSSHGSPAVMVRGKENLAQMDFCYYSTRHFDHATPTVQVLTTAVFPGALSVWENEDNTNASLLTQALIPGCLGAALVLIGAVLAWWIRRKRRRNLAKDEESLRENCYSLNGRVLCNEEMQTDTGSGNIGCVLRSLLDNETQHRLCKLMVDRKRVELLERVGEGAFGHVFRAKYTQKLKDQVQTMAVKVLKDACSFGEISKFVTEAVTMSEFHHRNVLNIIGVCLNPDTSVPMLILPYMKHGDLQCYLRSFRYEEQLLDKKPSVVNLVSFGLQVAKGMEYLANMKFVHRDLAARNCMVSENLIVKVADFGLTRDIYCNNYYRQDQRALLPVKWMALESLEDRVYTTKSDVWSYGVTLWEILTLAMTPYPTLDNSDVLTHVKKGGRPEIPDECPDHIYEIMQRCWNIDRQQRPHFYEIVDMIETYLSNECGYLDFTQLSETGDDVTGTDIAGQKEKLRLCSTSSQAPLELYNETRF